MPDLLITIGINLVLIAGGFFWGWRAHKRVNIDYKGRWQASNKLLQEERTTSGALAELESSTTDRPQGPWKIDIRNGGSYTHFFALHSKTGEQVQLGSEDRYPESTLAKRMKRKRKEAQEIVDEFNLTVIDA